MSIIFFIIFFRFCAMWLHSRILDIKISIIIRNFERLEFYLFTTLKIVTILTSKIKSLDDAKNVQSI